MTSDEQLRSDKSPVSRTDSRPYSQGDEVVPFWIPQYIDLDHDGLSAWHWPGDLEVRTVTWHRDDCKVPSKFPKRYGRWCLHLEVGVQGWRELCVAQWWFELWSRLSTSRDMLWFHQEWRLLSGWQVQVRSGMQRKRLDHLRCDPSNPHPEVPDWFLVSTCRSLRDRWEVQCDQVWGTDEKFNVIKFDGGHDEVRGANAVETVIICGEFVDRMWEQWLYAWLFEGRNRGIDTRGAKHDTAYGQGRELRTRTWGENLQGRLAVGT